MSKAGRTEFNDIDDFLGHNPTSRSGGFLSGWKKDGAITVFLHMKKLPVAVWRHPLPTIVAVEDKDTRKTTKRVFTKEYTCHEHEETLSKQYFRDDDGDREYTPKKCGLCKLTDWFYHQCLLHERTKDEKKPKGISWTTPVFRFEGDDDEETTTLRAGGLCGLFGQKDLTPEQKAELKAARVNLKEDWNQNIHAKMKYAMSVVNVDAPDEGVQIALESKALGDAVKAEIKKAIKSLGREEGNPTITPWALEWEYDKNEQFSKMYAATRIEKVVCTPKIKKLISGSPPDLSGITTPFNQKTVRSMLERACLLDEGVIPWDDLFPDEDEEEEEPEDSDDDDDDGEEEEKPAAKKSKKESEPKEEEFECDECGKPSPASAKKCPHCGMKFDTEGEDEEEDEEEEKEEETPKPRKRSEVAKEKAAAKSKEEDAPKKKTSGKKSKGDDDVPF
jgi:hypothetical protein